MPKVNYAKLYTLRPDGRYQGYWHSSDGKRHTACDKDPEALYRKIQEKEAAQDKPTTFGEIAEAWLESAEKELKPGTWACYDAPYARAVAEWKDTPAADISTPDVKELLQELAQTKGRRTVSAQRTVIKLIFAFAINDRRYSSQIKYNPAADAAMPKTRKPQKRSAPEDEIVQAICTRWNEVPYGGFAFFLICTGLRRGEALALQWKDIDFGRKIISVSRSIVYRSGVIITEPKTEAGIRTVPILPQLEPMLTGGNPDEYLFHGEDTKKPMVESTFRRHWKNYCVAMGFYSSERVVTYRSRGYDCHRKEYTYTLTSHVLRHGYATLLMEAGIDIKTAQHLLGHSDPAVTEKVYQDLRNRHKLRQFEALRNAAQTAFDASINTQKTDI